MNIVMWWWIYEIYIGSLILFHSFHFSFPMNHSLCSSSLYSWPHSHKFNTWLDNLFGRVVPVLQRSWVQILLWPEFVFRLSFHLHRFINNYTNLIRSYYIILQVMSRLPEFMSQVRRFGSSVTLIILKLSSFPDLPWHFINFITSSSVKSWMYFCLADKKNGCVWVEITL